MRYIKLKERVRKIAFPVTGLIALLWFLIRVIPKPSRAAYPCQRAAFPIASAFVLWMIGTFTSAWALRRMRKKKGPELILPVLLLTGSLFVVSLIAIPGSGVIAASSRTVFDPIDGSNNPFGTARGIYPGRVTWIYHPEAVRFDGSTGKYWQADKVDQEALDIMFSRSIRMLTGEMNESDAWNAVFSHFNLQHGKGETGYQQGEKIAVKLNMNTANGHNDTDDYMNTTPHATLALCRQLVDIAGVPEEMISFFEVSRPIPDYVYDMVHNEYPGIIFIDSEGGDGRLQYTIDTGCELAWSQELSLEEGGGNDTFLPKVVSEASYIINLANLKGHDLAGQSLCAKNHVGSIIAENPDQPSLSDPRAAGIHPYLAVHDFAYWSLPMRDMGTYNTLVDLMGHRDLGEKTLIFIIDALFATQVQHSKVDGSMKWGSIPFENHFTSSIFMSLDGVAIESVGLDFTRNEPSLQEVYGNVDNYLHEAALADNPPSGIVYDPEQDGIPLKSLGAHEHWNHAAGKKYSVNLGTGHGVELVSYRYGLQEIAAPDSLTAQISDTAVLITWADKSGNEEGFKLERKQFGETTFSPVDTIPADRVYFRDRNVVRAGTAYYRLKATGTDGDSEYSAVLNVFFDQTGTEEKPVDALQKVILYPNPASSFIRSNKDIEEVRIFNMSGKMLYFQKHLTSGGRIDLSPFPKGTCIIEYQVDGRTSRETILVR